MTMPGRIDPRLIAEIRQRVSLAELIGAAVALKPAGRELRGLCPFHAERTPSFYVVEAKGFWHCFGCGAHGDAIGWITRTTNATFPEAIEYLASRAGLRADLVPLPTARPIVQRPAAELLSRERRAKIAGARQLWAMSGPIAGTVAARYLREARRIRLAPPPSLRFHPNIEHPFAGAGCRFAAMVAAIQGEDEPGPDGHANGRAVVGVHCTYLARGGIEKAPPPPGWPASEEWKTKIMRGAARGGAVRLTMAEDVMVVAEGIETALAALQVLYDSDHGCAHIAGEPVGVWAALSLDNLGAVKLPAGVRDVILAADSDGKIPDADDWRRRDPEAALLAAAQRHADQGRNVRIARPAAGGDFNDLLPSGAGWDAVADADFERVA